MRLARRQRAARLAWWCCCSAAAVPSAEAALPYDEATDHLTADCFAVDYCEPHAFEYRLCKLRTRRPELECDAGYACERVPCDHQCWLPPRCWCDRDGHLANRMMCTDDCFTYPTTDYGLCVRLVDGVADDEPLPTHYHFETPDAQLYNARLHINGDSPFKGPVGRARDEL